MIRAHLLLDVYAMPQSRRPIPEGLLLVWYVAVAPLGGAFVALTAFNLLARPALPPAVGAWLGLGCAAAGLLVGGVIGATAPRSIPDPLFAGPQFSRGGLLNAALLAVVLVIVGAPYQPATAAAALAFAGAAGVFTVYGRRRRNRR